MDKIKISIKQYDLLPKLLSILLAVILWANLQSSQIDEITYHIYPEIKNLPQNLVILEDIQKIKITLRGKKEYIKSLNVSNIKLFVDVFRPVIGKKHEYLVRIQYNPLLSNIEYFLEKEKLNLTICKMKNKIVPIEPVILGEPSPQYKKGIVVAEPQLVQISGADIIIDTITSVKTHPLNIDKESQTLQIPVHINIKEYPKLYASPDTVRLTIPIVPVTNLASLTLPIEIRNRQSGINYALKNKNVIVYIKKWLANVELNEKLFVAYVNGAINTHDQEIIKLPVIIEKKTKVPLEIFTYEPLETEVYITHEEQ
ncbi:MAG: CdaR family protein [Spirochaetota bacterium]